MLNEKAHQIALKFIPGVGDVNAKQLISYAGSATNVFALSRAKLEKIPGIGQKTVQSLVKKDVFRKAESVINDCDKSGIDILSYADDDYPARLKLVNDGPLILFYKGSGVTQRPKVVGVVGTRKATNYGKSMTEEIIRDLVPHDALIVSGLAYGIDIAAHRSAVKRGLPTIAVLAGGLDKIYPSAHKGTVSEMLSNGGIVSEHGLGTTPEAHYFPARNRIIAGMSDALIVVEAGEKGGALISAEVAHSYDRDVFAVPGNLNSEFSKGCNRLIASQKANIYTGVKDLEYLLNWSTSEKGHADASPSWDLSKLSEEEQKLVKVLMQFRKGLILDELSWKTQIPVNRAVSLLLQLEFANIVKTLPGKVYQLA